LADPSHRVRILIFPPDKSVNGGKPILISFIPGQTCNYGDNRGCVNTYLSQTGVPVTFITVHSGVGGEGQAYRQAMEGSGINSAGLSLKAVRAHLHALEGAEVVIIQGKRRYGGYVLVVTARIPSRYLKPYFETDIRDALAFASSLDENLAGLANGGQPLLVFETCGWKMPGEPWARGVTSTTASVYLGVIQRRP
jgi:DNA-binding transcriptional ArsR family regulator